MGKTGQTQRESLKPLEHNRINEKNIDALRALAVSSVVIHHLNAYLGFSVPILHHVTIIDGVSLFFVISGYLISKSAERHDLRSYVTHRLFRIYPAFLVAFTVIGLLTYENWFARVGENPAYFMTYLLLLQHLFPQALVTFSTLHVEWTLTLELLWYAVAYPLMRLSKTGALVAAGLALALSMGWYEIGLSGGLDGLYGGRAEMEAIHPNFDVLFIARAFPSVLWLFFTGFLIYRFEKHLRRVPSWALVAAFATGLIWSLLDTGSLNPALRGSMFMGAMLLLVLRMQELRLPAINWLSDVSYSIYLLHAPIFVAVGTTMGFTGPWGAALALPVTLLASTILFVLVEQPCIRFARTLEWSSFCPRPRLASERWWS